MDWPNDPWTQSGYSFPAPGQVTTVGPIMYKGLGHLHFAGEHTSYKFVGYMEGALNSGAALAQRLAKRDGVVIKMPTSAPVATTGKSEPAPASKPTSMPKPAPALVK
jgi:hypothetical protein